MEPITPFMPAELSKAYARLDSYSNDSLHVDFNLERMADALHVSELNGGVVKPLALELENALSEPTLDSGKLMLASIRLNEATNNMAVLDSAVTTFAALPNKLLKLGGGG